MLRLQSTSQAGQVLDELAGAFRQFVCPRFIKHVGWWLAHY